MWATRAEGEVDLADTLGCDVITMPRQLLVCHAGVEDKTGKYTVYSERKKRKSDAAAAKKSREEKQKEAKLRRKAKEELQSFRSLMGMAGMYFGPCEHEFEL